MQNRGREQSASPARFLRSRFLKSACLKNKLLFRIHQCSDPLFEQRAVERFLERLVDHRSIEVVRAIVGENSKQNRFAMITIASKVLANLERFSAADRKIDDDAVRAKAFRLNAGLKDAARYRQPERSLR